MDSFIAKYNGKPCEKVDANALNQCVDLIVAWIEEGLKLPRLTSGIRSAYQIYFPSTSGLRQHFNFIENSPLAVPKKGDIVVWKSSYNGGDGHTAVATGRGNVIQFEAFSQNDPVRTLCTLKWYNYRHVHGFLRPKVQTFNSSPATPPMNDQESERRRIAKTNVDAILNYFKDEGFIDNSASEIYLDDKNDEYKMLGLVKRIVRDLRESGGISQATLDQELAKQKEDIRNKISAVFD